MVTEPTVSQYTYYCNHTTMSFTKPGAIGIPGAYTIPCL